jgi:ankyrin repeat protein
MRIKMLIISIFSLCFWVNSVYGMHDDCGNFFKPYSPQKYHAKKLKYAYAGNWSALRALSAEIQTKNLLKAASTQDWESVKTIIRKNNKVNVNAYNEMYYFPLLCAVHTENQEMVSFLLIHGAHPNQRYHAPRNGIGLMRNITYYNCYEDNKTALFDAVQNKNLEIMNLLITHNADINVLNKVGQNPLLRALDVKPYTLKTFAIVSILLALESDVNIQEDILIISNNNGQNRLGGQTALIKDAQKSPEMVTLLLKHGACNINAQDAQQKTAYDYALEAGFKETAILLHTITQTKKFPQPHTRTMHDVLSW